MRVVLIAIIFILSASVIHAQNNCSSTDISLGVDVPNSAELEDFMKMWKRVIIKIKDDGIEGVDREELEYWAFKKTIMDEIIKAMDQVRSNHTSREKKLKKEISNALNNSQINKLEGLKDISISHLESPIEDLPIIKKIIEKHKVEIKEVRSKKIEDRNFFIKDVVYFYSAIEKLRLKLVEKYKNDKVKKIKYENEKLGDDINTKLVGTYLKHLNYIEDENLKRLENLKEVEFVLKSLESEQDPEVLLEKLKKVEAKYGSDDNYNHYVWDRFKVLIVEKKNKTGVQIPKGSYSANSYYEAEKLSASRGDMNSEYIGSRRIIHKEKFTKIKVPQSEMDEAFLNYVKVGRLNKILKGSDLKWERNKKNFLLFENLTEHYSTLVSGEEFELFLDEFYR